MRIRDLHRGDSGPLLPILGYQAARIGRIAVQGIAESLRQAGNDLDLEIETREPVHAHRRPVRIRVVREDLRTDGVHRPELGLRIGMEGRDVDDVVQTGSSRLQNVPEVIEGQLDLLGEIRFRGAVRPAPDLAGDEKKIPGADRCGIAVDLVKGLPAGGENCIAFGNDVSPVPNRRLS